MAPSPVLERIIRDFEAVATLLPDSAVSRDARLHAAQELSRLGWPSARDEQWRYANLRAFDRVSRFQPVLAGGAQDVSAVAALPELPPALPGFERLIFIDGMRAGRASAGTGATVASWPAEQRLGFLCDMFAGDVASLRVNGSAAIEVLFVTSEASSGAAAYPRLQVHVESGARLKLVERHLGSTTQPALVGANVTIGLDTAATLAHYRLQQCGPGTIFSDNLVAEIAAGATYQVRQVAIGAATARTGALVRLSGRAAALDWKSIAVGRAEQVHDLMLKVEHLAPATRTEEMFRGIAEERSHIAFSGHMFIGAEAPASDVRQSLRGLIEGSGAEIDLRPRLEINTDDVKAQHGATTGQLDENLLFYLLARGLDRATARALLKWAFLGDVLQAIDLPALRSAAEHGAAGQLPDVMAIGALT